MTDGSRGGGRDRSSWWVQVPLVVGGAIMVLPFVWMVLTAFKSTSEMMRVPPVFFPAVWRFDNFRAVIDSLPFLTFYRNSVILTVVRTVGQMLFCSMAAFAFAKLRFPGKNGLFLAFLSVLMVPWQMTIIPNYINLMSLGLVDTLFAAILPGVFSAFGLFLMRQFFMKLPNELLDSGRVDGCNYFQILFRIYLPLTGSALTALAIFTIMYSWNDFIWPLIITVSDKTRVLSIGIALLQGNYMVPYNQIMAGAVMATIPLLLLFVILQRYFIEGIALTGLKG